MYVGDGLSRGKCYSTLPPSPVTRCGLRGAGYEVRVLEVCPGLGYKTHQCWCTSSPTGWSSPVAPPPRGSASRLRSLRRVVVARAVSALGVCVGRLRWASALGVCVGRLRWATGHRLDAVLQRTVCCEAPRCDAPRLTLAGLADVSNRASDTEPSSCTGSLTHEDVTHEDATSLPSQISPPHKVSTDNDLPTVPKKMNGLDAQRCRS